MAALNGAIYQAPVVTLTPGSAACQPDVVAPDAERVRAPATVQAGAVRTRVVVTVDGRRLEGAWAPARRDALVMALPRGTPRDVGAEVCVESEGPGQAALQGQPTGEPDRLRIGDGTGTGRMRLEYLFGRGEQPLWGSAAGAVAGRIAGATGSAWAPWIVGLGLLGALFALAVLVRGASGRRELLAVALLAFGSAGTWSGITPLFQASDELSHAAYVQVFSELGHPPRDRSNTGEVPEEMACWAHTTRFGLTRFFDAERPAWRRAPKDPCEGQNRRKDAAQYQSAQPPAYYAMARAGYEAASALDRPLPDRLLLSRLISALLAAITVLSVFLLVRDAFPQAVWPARAAALAAGLQPVMMFNHGVINSDALVFSVSAAVAAVLARAWRRGPTLRRAVLLGALLGLGLLAKITFLLVVPLALAVQVLIWLRAREVPLGRRALLLGATWATALVPAVAYVLLGDAIWEPAEQDEARVSAPVNTSKLRIASYVWQSVLPPLPFMEDVFPGARPPGWHGMITGPTSRLGWWDDYGIEAPASTLLLIGAVSMLAWAAVTALRRRAWRLPLAVGVGVGVTYPALLVWALYIPHDFQVQGRYMGVLLPLWGLAAGTAIASLRPARQGPAVAVLAIAMVTWTALALAATLGRFYL